MSNLQKPDIHYFSNGLVKFRRDRTDHQLYYEVRYETLTRSALMQKGKVKDQEHLDNLLGAKDINEFIPHLV